MFPLSPLGNVMPAREWIREYPRRVTSAEPPESREAGSSPEPVVRQMGATYGFGRFAVAPLARMIYRPHVEGRAHVPRTGPGSRCKVCAVLLSSEVQRVPSSSWSKWVP